MKKIIFVAFVAIFAVTTVFVACKKEVAETPSDLTITKNSTDRPSFMVDISYHELTTNMVDFYTRCIGEYQSPYSPNRERFYTACVNNDYELLSEALGFESIQAFEAQYSSSFNNMMSLESLYPSVFSLANYPGYSSCDCAESGLMGLYSAVEMIGSNGGYLEDLIRAPIATPHQFATCLTVCHFTCMSLMIYPPSYFACLATCTAMCYLL